MILTDAPEGLNSIITVCSDGTQYALTILEAQTDAMPLERRVLAHALRQLADAVDAEAERVGD